MKKTLSVKEWDRICLQEMVLKGLLVFTKDGYRATKLFCKILAQDIYEQKRKRRTKNAPTDSHCGGVQMSSGFIPIKVDWKNYLAYRINTSRRFMKMSKSELARRLKVSPACITQIENGKRLPSLPMLMKIANVLNQTPDYLLAVQIVEEG